MRYSSSGNEQKLDELQEEIEQLSIWKDKVGMVDHSYNNSGRIRYITNIAVVLMNRKEEIEHVSVWKKVGMVDHIHSEQK